MTQWGSPPGWPGDQNNPFGDPVVRPEAPPVFGASPFGAPPQPGWGQQPVPGYPPQFQPPPPPRRRGKVIGIVAAAIVAVIALVIGSVVVWKFTSGNGSASDTTAGKSEVASAEARPPREITTPSLSAAPTGALWSWPPGGESGAYTQVLGGDSKTVIVKSGDSIVGLDATSGSQVWQQPWPKSNGSYPYCVVSSSGETAVCDGGSATAVILDMKTGATRSTVSGEQSAYAYAGSGLLAVVDNMRGVTVFDDSGQQLWKKSVSANVFAFLDQRIIAEKSGTSTKFYDAETGDDLFSLGYVDDLVATSRGIAVSVRGSSIGVPSDRFPKQTIEFYSFTGKKVWSIPEDDGYRLPNAGIISRFSFDRSVQNSTSGVTVPIVYSEDKSEIAGVDVATGDILWSQPIPLPPKTLVNLSGVGNLCVVSFKGDGEGVPNVRVRDCNEGTGAFIADTVDESNNELVVADGSRTVIGGGRASTAYDTETGSQLWQTGSDVGTITWVGDGLYGATGDAVSRLS